jgi:hypothetical protein
MNGLRLALVAWLVFMIQCKRADTQSATMDAASGQQTAPCTEVVDAQLQEVQL